MARTPRTRLSDEDLKLSPEVAWYLESRGIPRPTCPPKFKTPEAGAYPGALFSPERVDRVLAAFERMCHTQGKWAGRPLRPDPWNVAYILAPVYGWVRPAEGTLDGLARIVRTEYVDVSRKNGKGLDVTTPILTADGWKSFGDLRVGDLVHAEDGSLTNVSYVSPVHELDCYEVTFGDGQSFVCDSDHLWSVWDRRRREWVTIDTPGLFRTHRFGSRGDTRYAVRTDRVIDRPPASLPIDPYLLGVWLGDGSTDAARVTTVDPEIVAAFEASPWKVHRVPGTITYAVNGGFRVMLREIGVLGNKHVPDAYLTASTEQRLALLRGLMDTDGGVNRGPNTPRVEFCSMRRELAEAVLFLSRSLGWKATLREGVATLNGRNCGVKFRVCWTAFRSSSPFLLRRKTELLHERPEGKKLRSSTNVVSSVRRVPSVPTRCIQVEHPSRQFLIGRGLTPTHNTTLAGGQAIYLTAADGEDGAQVVAAAAGKDQAKFCFDPAKQICSKSPALSRNVRVLANRIVHPRTASYFQAVSALADLQHGANIHGGIIDELHVHKTRDLVDALETGTGAREQPLIIIITTPDDSRQGTIYDEKRTYCEQLARGVLSDPTFYGVIWGADDADDPFAESTHRKANPGYGISPTKEFLESEARKARQSPANLARFKRLHLGIRTKQDSRYIDLPVWDRNAGRTLTEDILAGRPCYGGLDLGATSDLTALCWDFPDGQGGHDLLWRHWVPERAFIKLNERTAGQAALWREEGLLAVTPGDVADYDWIREQIRADRERFAVLGIGYDPWNATQIVNDLVSDGAPMVKVRQGFVTLTAPTKQLLHTLLEGSELAPRYRHGGNPLVRWQVDNLGVAMDASGNVKPDKAKSADKIDGLAAAVDALSLSMNYQPPKRSVYEDRGLTIA